MRRERTIAAAFFLASLLSATFFAWALWYLLSNPPLRLDGPEPNTVQFLLELGAWEQLTYASVAAYLALSICGVMFAGTVYSGRRGGRVGLATVLIGVLAVATVDWILAGNERDLITLGAVATFVVVSIWVLYGPITGSLDEHPPR